jgi:hypothetical protein
VSAGRACVGELMDCLNRLGLIASGREYHQRALCYFLTAKSFYTKVMNSDTYKSLKANPENEKAPDISVVHSGEYHNKEENGEGHVRLVNRKSFHLFFFSFPGLFCFHA